MAADKKSYLRNAQKQVKKGQLDRAITTYKAILKLDPNDDKIHNALGDLLIRRKMKKEGIAEYLWVANYYEKDGFHLRSIAICQKILNIDQDQIAVRLKLADLYSQQRLSAEAKKQYLQVADYFDKKNDVAKALEVFGKIADLDPGNLNVRVKLGVMYEKQSLPSKAAQEYTRAAEGYIKQKQFPRAADLLKKSLELNAESPTARRALAELHAGREEWDEAVRTLAPLVTDEAVDLQILKTYAGACLKTGRIEESIQALEKARDKEPSSLPVKTLLGRAYLQGDKFDMAFDLFSPTISGYLKDNKLDAAEDLARQLVEARPQSDRAQQRLLEIVQRKGETDEVLRIYVSLAGIYEKKGLLRNAVGVLERYLEERPDDQAVAARIEQLRGSAPQAQPPPAPPPPVEEEMEVEMIDLEGDDLSDLETIETEGQLQGAPAAGAGEAAAEGLESGLPGADGLLAEEEEEEIVIEPEEMEDSFADVEMAAVEETREESAVTEPAEAFHSAPPGASEELTVEPVLEAGETGKAEPFPEVVETEAVEAPGGPADEQGVPDTTAAADVLLEQVESPAEPAEGLDLDFDALKQAEEVATPVVEGAGVTEQAGTSLEIEEFLAEADFYMQQGLFDEADFLYRKLSKLDPDNEDITERIRRLENEKAKADAPVPEAAAEEETLIPDTEIAALESDLDRAFGDDTKIADMGLKISVRGDGGEESPGEFSDFLSELRQEIDTDLPEITPVVSDEESLSDIFQEFQKGLKDQLGEEDFETHYNLGIAYKEMGLMEEALGEFVLSEKSEVRKLDSFSMIALCYRGMGREEEAMRKLEKGLQIAEEGSDEQKGFLYDLIDLYRHLGRESEAWENLERLFAIDPDYRDIAALVAARRQGPATPPSGEGTGGGESDRAKKPKVSYL